MDTAIKDEATAMLRDQFAKGREEYKRDLFQEWRMQRLKEVADELQQAVDDLGLDAVQDLLDSTEER
jgi:hypothetical protein